MDGLKEITISTHVLSDMLLLLLRLSLFTTKTCCYRWDKRLDDKEKRHSAAKVRTTPFSCEIVNWLSSPNIWITLNLSYPMISSILIK